jgi:hypothetical protein
VDLGPERISRAVQTDRTVRQPITATQVVASGQTTCSLSPISVQHAEISSPCPLRPTSLAFSLLHQHRTHTTSTLMTTTSSMAEEQATEPMGNLRGGPEQDETMGEPVGGAAEEAPRPTTPPLEINTNLFEEGYRGLPWGVPVQHL